MVISTGGRQVNHHAAGFGVAAKVGCAGETAGNDPGSKSETSVVHGCDRLIVGIDLDHASHGCEQFLAVYLPVVAGTDKNRRVHEITLGSTIDPFSAAQQFAALLFRELDIGEVLLQLGIARYRADLGTGFERMPDNHVAGAIDQAFDELIVDVLVYYKARRGGTFLTGAAESATQRTGERRVEVGVIHYRECILGTHFKLYLGKVGHRGLRDAPPHRYRTGKADRVDLRAFHQRLADSASGPHDEVEQPCRNVLTGNDFGQCYRTRRHQVGRLPDHRVTERERRGNLPHGSGNREIPR